MAKASRGLDGLPKQKCVLDVPSNNSTGGLADNPRKYYMEEWSPSTPKCLSITQGSLGVMWLVLGCHHGDSHIHRSRCKGRAPKEG